MLFLEVFGDKTNVPEDMKGRWLLLPDTGALSGSGPSCSLPIYYGGRQKSLWLCGGEQGLDDASQRPQHSPSEQSPASLEGGTHTTPQADDLYQGQSIFTAR